MKVDEKSGFPELPSFSCALIKKCTQTKDFRPILFEWYKFVGLFCNFVARISPKSTIVKKIPQVHYAILSGSLNRCSRLMLSNARLSSTRRYGETTRLIDRCISESAIKIQWLCCNDDPDCFVQYLADGLKKDLILKTQIEKNIANRNSEILEIEKRMLKSIQKCVVLSQLSEEEVNKAKKIPDLAKMFEDLGMPTISYTAIQRMGSHSIHGTWTDLILTYLTYDDEQGFSPRDHNCETQDVQFVQIIHLVLDAIKGFICYTLLDQTAIKHFLNVCDHVEKKMQEIQNLVWDSDFHVSSNHKIEQDLKAQSTQDAEPIT